MADDAKPKRKYQRRAKVQPLAVYAVVVTVKTGRKTETIYGESVRNEGGCLVVVSMDGPPPLVEKTRYIPLGSAEIEVCQRPTPIQPMVWMRPNMGVQTYIGDAPATVTSGGTSAGPQITPGPLEIARQRAGGNFTPVARPRQEGIVERNPDGVAVVTAGFLDGSPS